MLWAFSALRTDLTLRAAEELPECVHQRAAQTSSPHAKSLTDVLAVFLQERTPPAGAVHQELTSRDLSHNPREQIQPTLKARTTYEVDGGYVFA